jgi:hypothetical protein
MYTIAIFLYFFIIMNSLETSLETSIIIQKELDKCNEKMKQYEIKYNTEKLESLKILYDYLNEQLVHCDETEQKYIKDDIDILMKYL